MTSMNTRALFGLSALMSAIAFGVVVSIYLWPRLRRLEQDSALRALVAPHIFRFIGLSFLVPGVVSPALPAAFVVPAAYGDIVAALLALATTIALSRHSSAATPLVWIFNVWGTGDLLLAFYNGGKVNLDPGTLGAAFYIPTLIVPPLLILHGLIFWLLIRPNQRRSET
jgi:hypothetical protein